MEGDKEGCLVDEKEADFARNIEGEKNLTGLLK